MSEDWTDDIENILENIRQNSVLLNKHHKNIYFFYRNLQKYFRIPTICLSAIGSVSSVGLTEYLDQKHISALTCGLSLIVGIINSVELFLKINDQLETELNNSKSFYVLAVDIEKTLKLNRENRGVSSTVYLEKKYSHYIKLIENGNLVHGTIKDVLTQLPKIKKGFLKDESSTSSSLESENDASPSQNNVTKFFRNI